MRSRILTRSSLLRGLVLCAAVLSPLAGGAAVELAEQSKQASGVTVSVKPADVSTTAKTWTFRVGLSTHTTDLSDDLARNATLVDANGKEQPPTAWEGDPAGGHHRKGVLRFKPLSPRPDALELRIARPGEGAPRVFRWSLN